MAALAASDVSYSITSRRKDDSSLRTFGVTISFGDGALTYPAGGIPLVKAKMGMPVDIKEVRLVDAASGDGFVYKYDLANNKLRIYQGDNNNAADAPLIELLTSEAPIATVIKASVVGY
jgi:hypothetical protein